MKRQLSSNRAICSGDFTSIDYEPLIQMGENNGIFTRGQYKGAWVSQVTNIGYLQFILPKINGYRREEVKSLLRNRIQQLRPQKIHHPKMPGQLSKKQRLWLEKANRRKLKKMRKLMAKKLRHDTVIESVEGKKAA